MLTKEEKDLILKMLEEDLRQYVTEEEWKEYIPKLLKKFQWMPSRERIGPDAYINKYFTWHETEEGDTYWREWHRKVYNRVYYGVTHVIF